MKIFAVRLKELRLEKSLSQMALSRALGISQSSIKQWENEERVPNAIAVALIARYFKVSADYLLGLED